MINKSYKIWMKSVAVFVVFLMLWDTVLWAAPASVAPFLKKEIPDFLHIDKIEIPSELGAVQASFSGGSSSVTLVHIEDAHGEPEAQANIQAILEYLKKEYGFKAFFLEGAWSRLQPELLQFSPDAQENKKILSDLGEKGIMGGPENFLYANPQVAGYGIEELELYLKNIEQFRTVMKSSKEADARLKAMKAGLLTKASQTLNSELAEYFRVWSFHEEIEKDYAGHLRVLVQAAKEHLGLDLDDAREQYDWPMLVRFSKLKELEKNEEQRTKNEETARLEKWLGDHPRLRSLYYVIRTREDFEHFYEQASVEGFRFKDYPALSNQWGQKILASELDAAALISEVEKLESQVIEKLAQTEDERKFIEKYREYLNLKKLLQLELSGEEWKKIKARNENVSTDLEKIARMFYQTAEARDRAMFERAVKWIQNQKIEKAAVITGGFHSEGFDRLLAENGINHLRIQPRISKIHGRQDYLKLMTATSNLRSVSPAQPGAAEFIPFLAGLSSRSELRDELVPITKKQVLDFVRQKTQIKPQGIYVTKLTKRNVGAEVNLKLDLRDQVDGEQKAWSFKVPADVVAEQSRKYGSQALSRPVALIFEEDPNHGTVMNIYDEEECLQTSSAKPLSSFMFIDGNFKQINLAVADIAKFIGADLFDFERMTPLARRTQMKPFRNGHIARLSGDGAYEILKSKSVDLTLDEDAVPEEKVYGELVQTPDFGVILRVSTDQGRVLGEYARLDFDLKSRRIRQRASGKPMKINLNALRMIAYAKGLAGVDGNPVLPAAFKSKNRVLPDHFMVYAEDSRAATQIAAGRKGSEIPPKIKIKSLYRLRDQSVSLRPIELDGHFYMLAADPSTGEEFYLLGVEDEVWQPWVDLSEITKFAAIGNDPVELKAILKRSSAAGLNYQGVVLGWMIKLLHHPELMDDPQFGVQNLNPWLRNQNLETYLNVLFQIYPQKKQTLFSLMSRFMVHYPESEREAVNNEYLLKQLADMPMDDDLFILPVIARIFAYTQYKGVNREAIRDQARLFLEALPAKFKEAPGESKAVGESYDFQSAVTELSRRAYHGLGNNSRAFNVSRQSGGDITLLRFVRSWNQQSRTIKIFLPNVHLWRDAEVNRFYSYEQVLAELKQRAEAGLDNSSTGLRKLKSEGGDGTLRHFILIWNKNHPDRPIVLPEKKEGAQARGWSDWWQEHIAKLNQLTDDQKRSVWKKWREEKSQSDYEAIYEHFMLLIDELSRKKLDQGFLDNRELEYQDFIDAGLDVLNILLDEQNSADAEIAFQKIEKGIIDEIEASAKSIRRKTAPVSLDAVVWDDSRETEGDRVPAKDESLFASFTDWRPGLIAAAEKRTRDLENVISYSEKTEIAHEIGRRLYDHPLMKPLKRIPFALHLSGDLSALSVSVKEAARIHFTVLEGAENEEDRLLIHRTLHGVLAEVLRDLADKHRFVLREEEPLTTIISSHIDLNQADELPLDWQLNGVPVYENSTGFSDRFLDEVERQFPGGANNFRQYVVDQLEGKLLADYDLFQINRSESRSMDPIVNQLIDLYRLDQKVKKGEFFEESEVDFKDLQELRRILGAINPVSDQLIIRASGLDDGDFMLSKKIPSKEFFKQLDLWAEAMADVLTPKFEGKFPRKDEMIRADFGSLNGYLKARLRKLIQLTVLQGNGLDLSLDFYILILTDANGDLQVSFVDSSAKLPNRNLENLEIISGMEIDYQKIEFHDSVAFGPESIFSLEGEEHHATPIHGGFSPLSPLLGHSYDFHIQFKKPDIDNFMEQQRKAQEEEQSVKNTIRRNPFDTDLWQKYVVHAWAENESESTPGKKLKRRKEIIERAFIFVQSALRNFNKEANDIKDRFGASGILLVFSLDGGADQRAFLSRARDWIIEKIFETGDLLPLSNLERALVLLRDHESGIVTSELFNRIQQWRAIADSKKKSEVVSQTWNGSGVWVHFEVLGHLPIEEKRAFSPGADPFADMRTEYIEDRDEDDEVFRKESEQGRPVEKPNTYKLAYYGQDVNRDILVPGFIEGGLVGPGSSLLSRTYPIWIVKQSRPFIFKVGGVSWQLVGVQKDGSRAYYRDLSNQTLIGVALQLRPNPQNDLFEQLSNRIRDFIVEKPTDPDELSRRLHDIEKYFRPYTQSEVSEPGELRFHVTSDTVELVAQWAREIKSREINAAERKGLEIFLRVYETSFPSQGWADLGLLYRLLHILRITPGTPITPAAASTDETGVSIDVEFLIKPRTDLDFFAPNVERVLGLIAQRMRSHEPEDSEGMKLDDAKALVEAELERINRSEARRVSGDVAESERWTRGQILTQFAKLMAGDIHDHDYEGRKRENLYALQYFDYLLADVDFLLSQEPFQESKDLINAAKLLEEADGLIKQAVLAPQKPEHDVFEKFDQKINAALGSLRSFHATEVLVKIKIPESIQVEQVDISLVSPSELDLAGHGYLGDYVSLNRYRIQINGRDYYFGQGAYLKFTFPNKQEVYLYDNHNLFYGLLGKYLRERSVSVKQIDHFDAHHDAVIGDHFSGSLAPQDFIQFPDEALFDFAQRLHIATFMNAVEHDFAPRAEGWVYRWIRKDKEAEDKAGGQRGNERGVRRLYKEILPFRNIEPHSTGGIANIDLDFVVKGFGRSVSSETAIDAFHRDMPKLIELLPRYDMAAFFISDERYINPMSAIEMFASVLQDYANRSETRDAAKKKFYSRLTIGVVVWGLLEVASWYFGFPFLFSLYGWISTWHVGGVAVGGLITSGVIASITGAIADYYTQLVSDYPAYKHHVKKRFATFMAARFLIGVIAFSANIYLIDLFASPLIRAAISGFVGVSFSSLVSVYFNGYWNRRGVDEMKRLGEIDPNEAGELRDFYSSRNQWHKDLKGVWGRLPVLLIQHYIAQDVVPEYLRIPAIFTIGLFMQLFRNYMVNSKNPGFNLKTYLRVNLHVTVLVMIFGGPSAALICNANLALIAITVGYFLAKKTKWYQPSQNPLTRKQTESLRQMLRRFDGEGPVAVLLGKHRGQSPSNRKYFYILVKENSPENPLFLTPRVMDDEGNVEDEPLKMWDAFTGEQLMGPEPWQGEPNIIYNELDVHQALSKLEFIETGVFTPIVLHPASDDILNLLSLALLKPRAVIEAGGETQVLSDALDHESEMTDWFVVAKDKGDDRAVSKRITQLLLNRSEARGEKIPPEEVAGYRAVDFYKAFFDIQEWNAAYTESDAQGQARLILQYQGLADELAVNLNEIRGRDEAEKKELAEIEGIETEQLSAYGKRLYGEFLDAVREMTDTQTESKDVFTQAFYRALFIQKKKLKTELLLLKRRLDDPYHHRTKYPLVAFAVIRSYGQIAQLHRWYSAVTEARTRAPRFKTLNASGSLVYTLDYSGIPTFRIVSDGETSKVFQIVWKYVEIQGSDRILMPQIVPFEHDELDAAYRGRLHTIESQQRDFAQLVYHDLVLADLGDEITDALRSGNIPEARDQDWINALISVAEGPEGKGGLRNKRAKFFPDGEAIPHPRESLGMAEGAIKRASSQNIKHLESAQIGIKNARLWIRLRLEDIRAKQRGIERKRDYLFHLVRDRDIRGAVSELENLFKNIANADINELIGLRERFEELDQTYFRFIAEEQSYFHAQTHFKSLIAGLRGLEGLLRRKSVSSALVNQARWIKEKSIVPLKKDLASWHTPARSELRLQPEIRWIASKTETGSETDYVVSLYHPGYSGDQYQVEVRQLDDWQSRDWARSDYQGYVTLRFDDKGKPLADEEWQVAISPKRVRIYPWLENFIVSKLQYETRSFAEPIGEDVKKGEPDWDAPGAVRLSIRQIWQAVNLMHQNLWEGNAFLAGVTGPNAGAHTREMEAGNRLAFLQNRIFKLFGAYGNLKHIPLPLEKFLLWNEEAWEAFWTPTTEEQKRYFARPKRLEALPAGSLESGDEEKARQWGIDLFEEMKKITGQDIVSFRSERRSMNAGGIAVVEVTEKVFEIEFVNKMSRSEFREWFDGVFPQLKVGRQKKLREKALQKAGLSLAVEEGLIVSSGLAATEGFWDAATKLLADQKVAVLGSGESSLENVRFFSDVMEAKKWLGAQKVTAWVGSDEEFDYALLKEQVSDLVIMTRERLARLYVGLGLESLAAQILGSQQVLSAA